MSNSMDFGILLSTLPIELPVFHTIALELQHHLEQPNFSMEKTIRLVSEDQSLAGHILKMANSVAYMGLVPVETIKAAVIRLGSRQLCNIAMTVSQSGLYASENEVVHGLMQSLWEHSYSCALGCQWLAEQTGNRQHADHAYMAGLLHDIGKLFLLKGMERLNVMGVATQADLEKKLLLEVFEAHHVEQGNRLMQQWNMPDIYCQVVANHHDENFDPADTVMVIVRFLNAACKVKGLGLEAAVDIPLLEMPEALALKLDEEKVNGLLQVLSESKYADMDLATSFGKSAAGKRSR